MKTSDIPDALILEFLAGNQGHWTMIFGRKFSWWGSDGMSDPLHEADPWPKEMPEKLALSKMRSLHRRGLVGGCPCGCRGDFEITDKGLALIGKPRARPYSGY